MAARNDELEAFKDSLWDFILEHCDIMEDSGALFVKFHASGRANIEKRVSARMKYHYHRGDPRQKEADHSGKREQFIEKKKSKHEHWVATRAERRAVMEQLKIRNSGRPVTTREMIRIFLLKTHGRISVFAQKLIHRSH